MTESVSSVPAPPVASRRTLLATATAGLGLSLLGCRRESEQAGEPAADRQDIPLRVVWVGEADEFDIVRRAWGSVSPLPLEVTVVPLQRQAAAGYQQPLLEAARRADVMVYPLCGIASLYAADQLTPLGSQRDERLDPDERDLPPALRHAAMMYAGLQVSIPLGVSQPALVTLDGSQLAEEGQSVSWAEYHAWVERLDGAAAEPLAGGWAAAMFLFRAATSIERGWLFEREGMEPSIAAEDSVAVLDQMQRTADRYRFDRLTPAGFWSAIGQGELRGGIGFPAGVDRSVGSASFAELPSDIPGRRVLLDAFAPIGSLAAASRQTAASKQFLNWLAGGPGSETARRQIERLTLPPIQGVSAETSTVAPDGYQNWLRNHLQTAVTLPTLQLLRGGDYYASLNAQVERCLQGDATPQQALTAAAEQWRKITEEVGPERQQRAWRRAQGMLG